MSSTLAGFAFFLCVAIGLANAQGASTTADDAPDVSHDQQAVPSDAPELRALHSFVTLNSLEDMGPADFSRGVESTSNVVRAANIRDGEVIAAAAVVLPAHLDPDQSAIVTSSYLIRARLAAASAALTTVAGPTIHKKMAEWKISAGLGPHLVGFIVQQRLSTVIPADAQRKEGIEQNTACAYLRMKISTLHVDDTVNQIDPQQLTAEFAQWAVSEGRKQVGMAQYEAALQTFALAHDASPADCSYLGNAMRCFAELGRLHDLKDLGDAECRLQAVPQDVLVESARASERAGANELAAALYAKALRTNPACTQAQAGLDRIWEALQPKPAAPATRPLSGQVSTASTRPAATEASRSGVAP